MNMRFCVPAVAEPNRIAAQVLTTSPMNVSTLGLMRDRASQRTMVLSSTPQARPKALVQLRHPDFDVDKAADDDGTEAVDAGVFDAEDVAIRLSPLSARRFPRGRGWCRGGESPARACRWG